MIPSQKVPMPRMPSWIFAIVVLMLAAGVGISRMDFGDVPSNAPVAAEQPGGGEGSVVWSHGASGAAQNGEAHWQKHGSEFPEFHSAAEYEQGAQRFVTNPPPGTLTKKRENGDTLYYNPQSNTFAVATPDSEPRTMFRPDSGRAYWDRQ